MSSVVVIGASGAMKAKARLLITWLRKPTLLYVIPAAPTQGTPLL